MDYKLKWNTNSKITKKKMPLVKKEKCQQDNDNDLTWMKMERNKGGRKINKWRNNKTSSLN